jgi:hypothetical protein
MTTADLALSPLALKLVDPTSPKPLRLLAARGVAPALAPAEVLLVAAILADDGDDDVRVAAGTLLAAPAHALVDAAIRQARTGIALERLHAGVALDDGARIELFRHALASEDLRASIVERSGADTLVQIASIDAVLAASPRALVALATHPGASAAVRARCEEIAERVGIALGTPPPPSAATTTNDTTADEPSDDAVDATIASLCATLTPAATDDDDDDDDKRVLPLRKFLEGLSVAQKIRRATIGSGEERALLVRDTNRLVAEAAITSPRIQEAEVLRIAANRSVSSDVLRRVGDSREWMKSYPIKVVLTQNPRTPLPMAMRLLPMLRESDLKRIAMSRSVPGAIAAAAKRELQKKAG